MILHMMIPWQDNYDAQNFGVRFHYHFDCRAFFCQLLVLKILMNYPHEKFPIAQEAPWGNLNSQDRPVMNHQSILNQPPVH